MRYVETYTHGDGRIGVMVEFESPDDFTFRTDEFKAFAMDTALHIAALAPIVVSPDQLATVVPLRESDRREFSSGGQALLDQPFVRDPARTFGDVLKEIECVLGVSVAIVRFVRYGD